MAETVRYFVVHDLACKIMCQPLGLSPDQVNHRLKQWQKANMPDGVNVGRGVKAEYDRHKLWQVAIMAELTCMGFTPEAAAKFILSNNDKLAALHGFTPHGATGSGLMLNMRKLARFVGEAMGDEPLPDDAPCGNPASAMSAGTAETPTAAQGEARQRDPQGDAQ